MSEMTRWQHERFFADGGFLAQLRGLGSEQEGEIERLCQQEMAAWRARPTMREESSLQEPMRHARNAIREHLPVTSFNRWKNPKTQEYEHLGLKHLNFTLEEWQRINADSDERFARRRRQQQQITQPDAVVALAEELLRLDEWYNLALGVTITTGRRITEVLKTGIFAPKTDFTVWFKGQLKTKAEDLPAYEIPTLAPADLVMSAVTRLRRIQDCTQMSNDAVSQTFGPVMRQMTDRQLGALIPKSDPDQNLYTHLSRSIYGRLCVLYHCPAPAFDLEYMAYILGHHWYFREKDAEKRANLDSTLHYMDYVIGDGRGQVDGRRGIWLGTKPGVQVVDEFEKEWEMVQQPSSESDALASEKYTKEGAGKQQAVPTKKRSILNCTPEQKTRFDAELKDRRLAHQSELVGPLLDESVWYGQMKGLLAPVMQELEAATPLEAVRRLIAAYQGEVQQQGAEAYVQHHLGVSLDQIDQVWTKAIEEGHAQPLAYFEEVLKRPENYKTGAQKRIEKYQHTDFSRLPYSQLEHTRTPEAAQERVRRIVLTLMAYNERVQPRDRWYINAGLIYKIKTIRHEVINAYLKEHEKEIHQHHARLGIEPRYNRKMESVEEIITIPDEPFVP
jgi:hypothetical protein